MKSRNRRHKMNQVYKCSRHGGWLVHYVRLVRASRGEDRYLVLPYFACPLPGCGYIKSNKWRKAWPADPKEIAVLQQLKDGVPAELMPKLKAHINHPKNLAKLLSEFIEKCGESQ
jgi:hypothetical protein